jgi:hypothetical protein
VLYFVARNYLWSEMKMVLTFCKPSRFCYLHRMRSFRVVKISNNDLDGFPCL